MHYRNQYDPVACLTQIDVDGLWELILVLSQLLEREQSSVPVADPGFPVGGRQPPMRTLFGENVCENERN